MIENCSRSLSPVYYSYCILLWERFGILEFIIGMLAMTVLVLETIVENQECNKFHQERIRYLELNKKSVNFFTMLQINLYPEENCKIVNKLVQYK